MSEQRIIERIRKMLALANDLAASEQERETALRMAYKLLAQHNLQVSDVEVKAEPRVDNVNVCFGMPWVRRLSNEVAKLFFCKYYFGAKVNTTQIKHHFVGRESNAITAAVMADWITKAILKECRTHYKWNLCAESRAFATGAVDRLCERISEMRKEAENQNRGDGKSLVLADVYRTELEANTDFLKSQGVSLRNARTRTKDVDASAYGHGRAFGGTINLNRQVAQKPTALLR
jgi:hypothetical protein